MLTVRPLAGRGFEQLNGDTLFRLPSRFGLLENEELPKDERRRIDADMRDNPWGAETRDAFVAVSDDGITQTGRRETLDAMPGDGPRTSALPFVPVLMDAVDDGRSAPVIALGYGDCVIARRAVDAVERLWRDGESAFVSRTFAQLEPGPVTTATRKAVTQEAAEGASGCAAVFTVAASGNEVPFALAWQAIITRDVPALRIGAPN